MGEGETEITEQTFNKTRIGGVGGTGEAKRGGITLLSEYIPYVHSVSLGIWVKSGSINDGYSNRGISHFVEHMLFKGTDRRSAFDIAREIDDVGGHLNAYTSKEFTNFYVKVLKEDVPLAIDVIADIFLNSTFPQEELDREKGVVIQEIKMVEDSPEDYVHELAFSQMWGDHPMGYSILGEIDSVSHFDRDSIIKYRKTHHTIDNIIIGAVGNFEMERLTALLTDALNGVPGGLPEGVSSPKFIPGNEVRERDTEQVHIVMAFPALSYDHKMRYPQFIMNTVIGAGMSSRLFQEVREKRGLAYSVFSFISPFKNAGVFGIHAGTEKRFVEELMSVVRDELSKMTEIPLSDDELRSAKGQIKGNVLLSMENTGSRLSRMVKNELYFNRQIDADEIIREIDAITPGDVIDVAQQIIDPDKNCSVFLGPIAKSDIPI